MKKNLDWGGPFHNQIASRHKLGEPVGYDPSALRVDDAGSLSKQASGRLLFRGQSSSCIPRDKNQARQMTKELAEQLIGEEVDTSEGGWW